MEQLDVLQDIKREVDQDDTETAVEFLVEVRVPCLICGVNVEINNSLKQEDDQLDEWVGNEHTEEIELGVGGSTVDHNIFYRFLKWFGVDIVKKGKQRLIDRGWDGEGGDILRFCGNCKVELERVLEFQKELDELEKKIKNGLGEVERKMERSEEAVKSTGIYERDQRYKKVRSSIVKFVGNNSEDHLQDNCQLSQLEQPVAPNSNSSRRSSRLKVKSKTVRFDFGNVPITDDTEAIKDNTTSAVVQQNIIRRTSSRIKKTVLEKTSGSEPSGSQPNDNEEDDNNSLSSDQDSNIQKRKNNKWNYEVDPITNTIVFDGFKFYISMDPEGQVFCTSCNKMLRYNKEKMRTHIIKKHKKSFPCPHCPYTSEGQKRLDDHIRNIHNGLLEKCPQCGKSYAALKYHIKYQHGETELIKCTVKNCRKRFKTPNYLLKHIKAVHKKIMPWKCTMCKRKFAWKEQFSAHMNLHKGIRPFKCEVDGCGAAFAKKCTLKKHHKCYHEEGSNPKRKSFLRGPIVLKGKSAK